MSKKAPRKPSYHYAAKTQNQQKYLELIEKKQITIATGPPGSGKSYLALGKALDLLYAKKCDGGMKRIVLMRPAVEMVGEKLGALPGSADEKISPYMFPLLDNLHHIVDKSTVEKLVADDRIHAFPIAHVRGITLRSSFTIIDEAQNCLPSQLKCILTRMDDNSKIVLTGDLEQTDIKKNNGLEDALVRIGKIKEVGVINFTEKDIIRSEIIKKIIRAYRKKVNK